MKLTPLYDGPLPDVLHGGLLDAARTCQHPTAGKDLAMFIHVNLLGKRDPYGIAVWSALYSVVTRPGMERHLEVLLADIDGAHRTYITGLPSDKEHDTKCSAQSGQCIECDVHNDDALEGALRHLLWMIGEPALPHLLRAFDAVNARVA